jgi:hypothetical protein
MDSTVPKNMLFFADCLQSLASLIGACAPSYCNRSHGLFMEIYFIHNGGRRPAIPHIILVEGLRCYHQQVELFSYFATCGAD